MNAHSPQGSTPTAFAPHRAQPPHRRVVDAPMRMFHWLFALCFVGAYATADGERWRLLHTTLGYSMAGLLGFRVLYGLFGPRPVRLELLWRKARGGSWLQDARSAGAVQAVNWRQAQNLLMAWTVVLLLALVLPITLTGYATYHDWTDWLGGDWIEEVHEFFGEAMLWVVLLHLGLIALLSTLRRRNQALPMLTGRVAGPGPHLVQNNRSWLAVLLLLAVLAYGAWEWRQSPNGLVPWGALSDRARHHGDD